MGNSRSYIVVTFLFDREGDTWTAECMELGTAAFGNSMEEAEESLEQLVSLHLNTLEAVGECGRFLDENGIKIHSRRPKNASIAAKVPIGVLIQSEALQVRC